MMGELRTISLADWRGRYAQLRESGLDEPGYGGPLERHFDGGYRRLARLRFDPSPAALRLWNLVLTEEDRLHQARRDGRIIVGCMKDLGTIAVLAWSLPRVVAFYPDGCWWTPCIMEGFTPLLKIADSLGVGESFCPVRAMLGAFLSGSEFPEPDLLVCGVGATCDDFSAIAQRLEATGRRIVWWEVPHRRHPEAHEASVLLPGGYVASCRSVEFVRGELERVWAALCEAAGGLPLDAGGVAAGIRRANALRRRLGQLRETVFLSPRPLMPSLEMLLAEMLAIHYCSDWDEAMRVLGDLCDEVTRRRSQGLALPAAEAVRLFWVNPPADLRVMNLVEECGGRVCGTDYMFTHALDEIPEDLPPLEALARMVLADPMTGASADRAGRICAEAERWGCEAVIVCRVPGASHCATEGIVIADAVRDRLGLPVAEIDVPPVADPIEPALRTRIGAVIEAARGRRK